MPHNSDDLKMTAVRHYLEQSHNYDETSRVFHCPATSLKRWVERFQQIGTVARQKRDYVHLYKIILARLPFMVTIPHNLGTRINTYIL